MGTPTTKAKSSRKKTNKKKSAALATCPVGASGWCSYPFSVAQLERRLKREREAAEAQLDLEPVAAGKRTSK